MIRFHVVIREGIRDDGTTLFPMMPYDAFKTLSDDDLACACRLLRSVPPVKKSAPADANQFSRELSVRRRAAASYRASAGAEIYPIRSLVANTWSAERGCHNPVAKIPSMRRRLRKGPWGDVVSPNPRPILRASVTTQTARSSATAVHRICRCAQAEFDHAFHPIRTSSGRRFEGDLCLPEDASAREVSRRQHSPADGCGRYASKT